MYDTASDLLSIGSASRAGASGAIQQQQPNKFLSGILAAAGSIFGGGGGGSVAGSIFSGLGNMFSGRSARREQQRDREAQLRLAQMDIESRERLAEAERRWMLEDRGYRAESMGNYAQFNTRPGIVRPGPVSTTVSPIRQTATATPEDQQMIGGSGPTGGLLNFRGLK